MKTDEKPHSDDSQHYENHTDDRQHCENHSDDDQKCKKHCDDNQHCESNRIVKKHCKTSTAMQEALRCKKKGVVLVKGQRTAGVVQPSTGKRGTALDGVKLNLDDGTDHLPKDAQKQAPITDPLYKKPATQPTVLQQIKDGQDD
jgi:hypothetical protein